MESTTAQEWGQQKQIVKKKNNNLCLLFNDSFKILCQHQHHMKVKNLTYLIDIWLDARVNGGLRRGALLYISVFWVVITRDIQMTMIQII